MAKTLKGQTELTDYMARNPSGIIAEIKAALADH